MADDSPSNGDVLITSEAHSHFISVIPHPHRLSFTSFPAALELATRWASANNAAVWHSLGGRLSRLDGQPGGDSGIDQSA